VGVDRIGELGEEIGEEPPGGVEVFVLKGEQDGGAKPL